jgi:hypothetical protein
VTQEKLNLFQLSSREMAQTSAGPPQVMWSKALDSGASSSTLDDVPDCFGRDSLTAVQNNRFPIKQPLQGKALGQKESVNENEVWVS